MRQRLPWIITTVALVVAAVALTLWWTSDNQNAPSDRLTVKTSIQCQSEPSVAPGNTPGTAKAVECTNKAIDAAKSRCANSNVAAVEVVARYPTGGDSLPFTLVCDSLLSSSSG